jgi:hypothetical protein
MHFHSFARRDPVDSAGSIFIISIKCQFLLSLSHLLRVRVHVRAYAGIDEYEAQTAVLL